MTARSLPRVIFLALLSLAIGRPARSQEAPPPTVVRYTAAQLDCATFREHSEGRLEAVTGARRRRETMLRDGVLRFRARPKGDAIAIEAWYDSLALTRESPETTLAPDTDGLLGGRFRGTLSAHGRYAVEARPFVPDEVAEVADVGGALDDLLPPLPPRALSVGQRWANGTGLELRRLRDTTMVGRPVHRFALRARTKSDTATVRGDTTGLAATETMLEEGEVDWDRERGLVRRRRHLVIDTSVPAGGPLKLPLRSRLVQEVELVRGAPDCNER